MNAARFATVRKQTWTATELVDFARGTADACEKVARAARQVETAVADRSKPQDFYAAIADAYRQLDAVVGKPTTNIAIVANVPHTTAARWVHEARRQGHLGGDS